MASWWHVLVAFFACLCMNAVRVRVSLSSGEDDSNRNEITEANVEAAGKAQTGTQKAEMKAETISPEDKWTPDQVCKLKVDKGHCKTDVKIFDKKRKRYAKRYNFPAVLACQRKYCCGDPECDDKNMVSTHEECKSGTAHQWCVAVKPTSAMAQPAGEPASDAVEGIVDETHEAAQVGEPDDKEDAIEDEEEAKATEECQKVEKAGRCDANFDRKRHNYDLPSTFSCETWYTCSKAPKDFHPNASFCDKNDLGSGKGECIPVPVDEAKDVSSMDKWDQVCRLKVDKKHCKTKDYSFEKQRKRYAKRYDLPAGFACQRKYCCGDPECDDKNMASSQGICSQNGKTAHALCVAVDTTSADAQPAGKSAADAGEGIVDEANEAIEAAQVGEPDVEEEAAQVEEPNDGKDSNEDEEKAKAKEDEADEDIMYKECQKANKAGHCRANMFNVKRKSYKLPSTFSCETWYKCSEGPPGFRVPRISWCVNKDLGFGTKDCIPVPV